MYRSRGGGGGASEMGTLSQQPMTSNFAPKQGGSHLQDNYQPQTRHSGHLQQIHLQQSHLQQGNHQPSNLQQGQVQQGHLQATDNYHPRSNPSHTSFNCNPTQAGPSPSPIQNQNQRPNLGPSLSQSQRQMSHLQRGASLDLPASGGGIF